MPILKRMPRLYCSATDSNCVGWWTLCLGVYITQQESRRRLRAKVTKALPRGYSEYFQATRAAKKLVLRKGGRVAQAQPRIYGKE
jgi:hypothetical protein